MSKNHFQKFVTVFTLILLGLAATAYRVPAESKNGSAKITGANPAFQNMSSINH
ncbi:hypothetical protein [Trichlorobacter lovleyi]|uniref:hypothetical protein n=1 Tax=Trichlorobacter lovleyi TaxID=313985 RepID=UPI0024808BF2|nr:hypothetical protein [Trichlorobacter lovleyi]